MKLSDILAKNQTSISCEFFPPKTDKGEENLWNCIQELKALPPTFVSVTYGAGGSTRDRTKRIVSRIKQETDMEPVAHLTCVGSTREELGELLDEYKAANIENILALRGDPPENMDHFEAVKGGFHYASDLTAFICARHDFSIGVATYPEGHPESPNGVADDLRYLKVKQDNGADAAITQYFFDNDAFFHFRDRAVATGISIPILPGIMPITNYDQIVRFSAMCGATIPDWIHDKMIPVREDLDAVKKLGIEIVSHQSEELLKHGARGLHFYTLNKSAATIAVSQNLGVCQT